MLKLVIQKLFLFPTSMTDLSEKVILSQNLFLMSVSLSLTPRIYCNRKLCSFDLQNISQSTLLHTPTITTWTTHGQGTLPFNQKFCSSFLPGLPAPLLALYTPFTTAVKMMDFKCIYICINVYISLLVKVLQQHPSEIQ